MKTRTLNSLRSSMALAGLLTLSQQASAQILPDIGKTVQEAVQTAVERQVEQAQNVTVERVVQQAEAAAAGQALERAYEAVSKINFEGMHYRRDIGARALAQSSK